jgi:hypothetical protein
VTLDVYGERGVFAFEGGELRTIATTRVEERWTRKPRVWVVM